MIVIETCPKCGHELQNIRIMTYPSIPRKECYHCGWIWEGQPEEIVYKTFKEEEENEHCVLEN